MAIEKISSSAGTVTLDLKINSNISQELNKENKAMHSLEQSTASLEKAMRRMTDYDYGRACDSVKRLEGAANITKSSIAGLNENIKKSTKSTSEYSTVERALEGVNNTTRTTDSSILALNSTARTANATVGNMRTTITQAEAALQNMRTTSTGSGHSLDSLEAAINRARNATDELENAAMGTTHDMGRLDSQTGQTEQTMEELRTAASRTEQALEELVGAARTAENAMDGLDDTTRSTNRHMDSTASSSRRMSDAMGSTSGQTGRATSSMAGFTSSMVGAQLIATAVISAVKKITEELVELGKQAIEASSDLQEVQNVVNVAFGDYKAEVEDFAKTSLYTFGLSELAAKKTSSLYMALGSSVGLAKEDAAEMAVNLTKLSGDVASFYNKNQEDAANFLNAIYTGETMTLLQNTGVNITVGNLETYTEQLGLEKTYTQMSQAEKVGLRYKYVMEQLSLAQGDFNRTSDNWANQTRVLKGEWENFLGVLGDGLIEVLTPLLHVLTGVVKELTKFAEGVNNYFGIGTDELEEAANNAGAIGAAMSGALDDTLGEEIKTLKDDLLGLASFDELTILGSPGDKEEEAEAEAGNNSISSMISGGGYGEEKKDDGMIDKTVQTIESKTNPLVEITKQVAEDSAPEIDRIKENTSKFGDVIDRIKKDLLEYADASDLINEGKEQVVNYLDSVYYYIDAIFNAFVSISDFCAQSKVINGIAWFYESVFKTFMYLITQMLYLAGDIFNGGKTNKALENSKRFAAGAVKDYEQINAMMGITPKPKKTNAIMEITPEKTNSTFALTTASFIAKKLMGENKKEETEETKPKSKESQKLNNEPFLNINSGREAAAALVDNPFIMSSENSSDFSFKASNPSTPPKLSSGSLNSPYGAQGMTDEKMTQLAVKAAAEVVKSSAVEEKDQNLNLTVNVGGKTLTETVIKSINRNTRNQGRSSIVSIN